MMSPEEREAKIKAMAHSLWSAINHGDAEHRDWLANKAWDWARMWVEKEDRDAVLPSGN